MSYPIYQRQERVQYPNAKDMVVNWSVAGEKLAQGVLEGVSLGLKIKKSREESALNALNLKRGEDALVASQQNRMIEQARWQQDRIRNDNDLEIQQFKIDQLERERALGLSEIMVQNKVSQMKIEQHTLQQQTMATDFVANNLDGLEAVQRQLDDAVVRVGDTSNPFEKRNIIKEVAKSIETQAEKKGVSITRVASLLHPNDPWKQLLTQLSPAGIQALESQIKVPMITSNSKKTEYEQAEAQLAIANASGDKTQQAEAMAALALAQSAIGKPDSTVTSENIVWMPMQQAMTFFNMGMGQQQLDYLKERYKDDPSFQSWFKDQKFSGAKEEVMPSGEKPTEPTAIEKGQAREVTISGRKVTIPSTGKEEATAFVRADAEWSRIYGGKPTGRLPAAMVAGEDRPKDVEYFETQLAKAEKDRAAIPVDKPVARNTQEKIIGHIRSHLDRLKTQYGVKEISVTMEFPDGKRKLVSVNEKQKWLNFGGKIVP